MAGLGEFGEDVGSCRRNIGATVVASETSLLVGSTQQTRGSLRVVLHVATGAGIGCYRAIAGDVMAARCRVARLGMTADRPAAEKIYVSVHHTGRVVTGEAESAIGTVANQEVQHDRVLALDMGIVASVALHVAFDELNFCIPGVG